MTNHVIVLDVKNMPEVLACMRQEIASLLRQEAEGEPELVRSKLLQIATDFEIGLTWKDE